MLINYRIKTNTNIGKWASEQHNNKRKAHCDMCGSKLWINPGGGLYCNIEHKKNQL